MSYAHSYTRNPLHGDITQDAWKRLRNHFHQLLGALPDISPSAEEEFKNKPLIINHLPETTTGRTYPVSTADGIFFNGDKKEGMNNDLFLFCRTHQIQKEIRIAGRSYDNLNFTCDTGGKPYEFLVMATMILINHHVRGISITSDRPSKDWKPALDFVNKVTGVSTDMPSTIDQVMGVAVDQSRPKKQFPKIPVEGNCYF